MLSNLFVAYQSISDETFKQSAYGQQALTFGLNMQFIFLTKKIQSFIKNPKLLLDDCEKVMINKTSQIQLFQKENLRCFYSLDPAVLFQALCILWNWSDHSVLRELLQFGKHTEALKLLGVFDRDLENIKSIAIKNIPFPTVTSRMIHMDTKDMHTVIAIKLKKSHAEYIWENITEARTALQTAFKIKRNTLQLLGILSNNNDFMIYWMIPKCVISLITSTIAEIKCISDLYKNGISEVFIYPNAHFYTGNVKVEPFAVLMDTPPEVCIYSYVRTYKNNVCTYVCVRMYVLIQFARVVQLKSNLMHTSI